MEASVSRSSCQCYKIFTRVVFLLSCILYCALKLEHWAVAKPQQGQHVSLFQMATEVQSSSWEVRSMSFDNLKQMKKQNLDFPLKWVYHQQAAKLETHSLPSGLLGCGKRNGSIKARRLGDKDKHCLINEGLVEEEKRNKTSNTKAITPQLPQPD